MEGIPNAKIAAFVRQDAETALKNAATVICLNGGDPVVINNENPHLRVIAVIGPGYSPSFKRSFDTALLLEIGIGKTNPYKESKIPKDRRSPGDPVRIKKRRKWFWLAENQYLRIAPLLFAEMQKIVNQRIARRKKRNHLAKPPYKTVTRIFYSHRKSTLLNWDERIVVHPGSRFSVAATDEFLLSDVYWLEQQTDSARRGRTEGLAHRITERLKRYAKNGTRWRPEKLKGFKDIDVIIDQKLPFYKRTEVLRLIKETPKRRHVYEYFRNELEKLLENDRVAPETRLIKSVLPDPEKRLSVLRREEIERHLADVKQGLGWDDALIEKYSQRISSSPVWNRHYQVLVTTTLGRKDYIVFKLTHSLPTSLSAGSETPPEEEESLTPASV